MSPIVTHWKSQYKKLKKAITLCLDLPLHSPSKRVRAEQKTKENHIKTNSPTEISVQKPIAVEELSSCQCIHHFETILLLGMKRSGDFKVMYSVNLKYQFLPSSNRLHIIFTYIFDSQPQHKRLATGLQATEKCSSNQRKHYIQLYAPTHPSSYNIIN